jgi:hypothetical protein
MAEEIHTVRIEGPRIAFRLSEEDREFARRIADPQDLEDGLLAVRYEETRERLGRYLLDVAECRLLLATLFPEVTRP